MKEIIYTHWNNRAIESEPGEIWKEVAGTNGEYQVSNLGRIKSWARRFYYLYENNELIKKSIPMIMAQTKTPRNYLVCSIIYPDRNKSRQSSVHRIVCNAFNPNTSNLPLVHHVKNVRYFNAAINLLWADHQQNMDFIKLEHGNYEVIDICRPNNASRVPENSLVRKGYTYIYGITDETGRVIYVGKSDNPHQRFRNHHGKAKQKDHHWINELVKNGKETSFIILEQCLIKGWEERETFFISKYRNINPELNNISFGGSGFNLPKSIRDKVHIKRQKRVLQYARDGEFIKEWDSVKEAAKGIGINDGTLSVSIKDNNLSANYIWRFKTSDIIPKHIPAHESMKDLPVTQYDLDGNIIRDWDSAGVAGKKFGIQPGQIYKSIRQTHRVAANSFWRIKYPDTPSLLTITTTRFNRTYKPIFEILPDGSKKIWLSITEAANFYNIHYSHLAECLRYGKLAKGIKFEKDNTHPRWKNKHGKLTQADTLTPLH